MELRDYFALIRRSWILILSLALVGLLGGGLAAIVVKPTYESETQLFVAIQNSGSVQELQQGNTFSQARVQSYVKTVATPAVLQPVIDSLGLQVTAAQLGKKISAKSDLNTVIITITVTDGSAVQAAAIAQAVGDNLIRAVDRLERSDAASASPVKLSVVTPAVAPSAAASPNTRLSLLMGLLTGVALGFAGAVLRKFLDIRVRGEVDLRKITDAPILGTIAMEPDAKGKPLITQIASQSPRAESFRQLRTNLQFANVGQRSSAVLVTSSLPGEGKTTTATNMALALAQSGQSVVLVDADLRRPMVAEYLGLDRNAGLTTVIVGDADLNEMLQPWGENNLFILTSGRIPPNPSELLGSQAMSELISQLERTFDAVVIDSPPLLPVTDAAVLAQKVGGVLLVVDSQDTRQANVQKSLQSLEMVSANLIGIVLNRLPLKGPDAYGYGYAYTSHAERRVTPERIRPENQRSNRRAADTNRRAYPDTAMLMPSNPDMDRVDYGDLADTLRPASKFPSDRTGIS